MKITAKFFFSLKRLFEFEVCREEAATKSREDSFFATPREAWRSLLCERGGIYIYIFFSFEDVVEVSNNMRFGEVRWSSTLVVKFATESRNVEICCIKIAAESEPWRSP